MAEQSWTDTITAIPLVRRRSIHFTELQDAINEYEARYDIPGGQTSWTDSPATGVRIKTTAISEMYDALDALYQLANSTDFSWSQVPKITATVRAVHVNEARDAMNLLQDSFCIGCDSCDDYSGCVCDTGCHNDACPCNVACYVYNCTCNVSCYLEGCKSDSCNCYGYTTCSCNTGDNPCDLCYNACYEDTCNQCHVAAFRYPWT